GRLPALVAGVEDGAAGEAALVVHLHLVGGGRARALAGRQRLVDQAAGQLRRARLLRRFLRVLLARGLLLVRTRAGARLRERVHLLHLPLRLDQRLLAAGSVGQPVLDDLQLVGLERERRQVSAADQVADRVEGFLVVGLERGLRGGGQSERECED